MGPNRSRLCDCYPICQSRADTDRRRQASLSPGRINVAAWAPIFALPKQASIKEAPAFQTSDPSRWGKNRRKRMNFRSSSFIVHSRRPEKPGEIEGCIILTALKDSRAFLCKPNCLQQPGIGRCWPRDTRICHQVRVE